MQGGGGIAGVRAKSSQWQSKSFYWKRKAGNKEASPWQPTGAIALTERGWQYQAQW